jgi:hypothetical protein
MPLPSKYRDLIEKKRLEKQIQEIEAEKKKIRTRKRLSDVKPKRQTRPYIGILSVDDINALIHADHVLFRYIETDRSEITCIKGELTHSFVASSAVLDITTLQSITVQKAEYLAAFSSHDWEFQTIVGSLLPKDELEFLWILDAFTSEHCSQVNIHVDLLKVIIYRREFRLHHKIGVFAGTDTERMISI